MKLQALWNLMLADAQAGVYEIDIFQQILESRGVVLAVLVLLILMSLATWFIVGYKWLVTCASRPRRCRAVRCLASSPPASGSTRVWGAAWNAVT